MNEEIAEEAEIVNVEEVVETAQIDEAVQVTDSVEVDDVVEENEGNETAKVEEEEDEIQIDHSNSFAHNVPDSSEEASISAMEVIEDDIKD